MKVIGLTGGIGTGKSTVSAYLKEKQIPVIDADAIARDMTKPGAPVLPKISALLGESVLLPDGSLNRKAVADLIFQDSALLKAYEALTTREVIAQCQREIERCREEGGCSMAVLDAPLLFESGADRFVDETWLVCADLEVRLARVARRDGTSREQILRRIDHQMPDEEKKALADHVIDNSLDVSRLYEQVDRLMERNGI